MTGKRRKRHSFEQVEQIVRTLQDGERVVG